MLRDRAIVTLLGICAAILVLGLLYLARTVLAPVTFAIFIIAIVWPFQRALQARLPTIIALLITVVVIFAVVTSLAFLTVWGFSKVAHWFIGNSDRFQALYDQLTVWLETHGIALPSILVGTFNVAWLVRVLQDIASRVQTLISFALLTFIFVVLGLLEVEIICRNLAKLGANGIGQSLLTTGAKIARKFQHYMLVRTVMSVLTGIVIWVFALVAGLELATAWGVIAFVLNYIPFLGPFVATIFPTLFAMAQSYSWELTLFVFLGLNLIQFLIGSCLEPRLAGAALSVSPFMVLLAVFFWAFLWGIPGAFIGVPIVIAALAICDQHASSRWVATLLSGRADSSTPA
jgi:predicted PurR-regulated permease PerM